MTGIREHVAPPGTSVPGRVVGFRADIDGLRAVAILLVVGYHATVPGFAAGFIGVDVFFVISGFLIMTQLEKELRATGTVRLRTFWARRARRLIPAAAVTTLFVIVANQFVYSPFHWPGVATEALTTTFYVSNEFYRRASTDYFAPGLTSNPLLNTWSLAVEEQFYLLWPTLLVVVTRLFRTTPAEPGADDSPAGAHLTAITAITDTTSVTDTTDAGRHDDAATTRRARIIAVSIVVVLSFLLSLQLLSTDPPSAYFSSLSRAWEFGIGALLAAHATSMKTWGPGRTRTAAAAGVLLMTWTVRTITDHSTFPGFNAVPPVLGTAAIIIAGAGRDILPAKTIGWAPLQALGRLSYSWYLWHWPVMILGVRWLGRDDGATRISLVLTSLVPAWLTYRYVETVVRRAPRLITSNRRTAAVIIGFVLVTSSAALALWIRGDTAMQDPFLQRVAAARADAPALPPECATNDVASLLAACVRGDAGSPSTVLLIGDSHAAQWLPALDEVGKKRGVRVVASIMGVCPSIGTGYEGESRECVDKIAGTRQLFATLRPALVVLGNSVGYLGALHDSSGQVAPSGDQVSTWQRGVQARADELRDLGIPVLLINDTPGNRNDPNECLAKTRDFRACESTSATVLAKLGGMRQAEGTGLADARWGTLFDPLPLFCGDDVCPLDINGLVYCDAHHMTNATSRSLERPLAQAVLLALGRPAPGP